MGDSAMQTAAQPNCMGAEVGKATTNPGVPEVEGLIQSQEFQCPDRTRMFEGLWW